MAVSGRHLCTCKWIHVNIDPKYSYFLDSVLCFEWIAGGTGARRPSCVACICTPIGAGSCFKCSGPVAVRGRGEDARVPGSLGTVTAEADCVPPDVVGD